jgi:hypothetical protein
VGYGPRRKRNAVPLLARHGDGALRLADHLRSQVGPLPLQDGELYRAGNDPSRPSIKVWRDGLSDSERAKLNHPKRVWTGYLAATEPRAETEAKRKERERKQAEKSRDPMLDKVGEAEAETHTARRQVEVLRELVAFIRDHIDLPEDIAAKIDAVLRE